jgi:hypothetical protein
VLLSAASIEEVSPAAREYLNEVGAALSLHEVTLGWHHWSASELRMWLWRAKTRYNGRC